MMAPVAIRLDFGDAPWDAERKLGAALFVLGALLVTALLWLGVATARRTDQLEADHAARLKRQSQMASHFAPPDPLVLKQLAEANNTVDALSVRWDDLFVMIEGAGSKGLGLLSLVPDPRNHSLRISGEAKTLDDVLAYVGRLDQQPVLTEVALISYQTAERKGSPSVEFTVTAKWK